MTQRVKPNINYELKLIITTTITINMDSSVVANVHTLKQGINSRGNYAWGRGGV